MSTQPCSVGDKIGRITITAVYRRAPGWRVSGVCACGNTIDRKASRIFNGNVRSCGCAYADHAAEFGQRNTTHGMANSRVKGYASRAYGIWQAMRDRCSNSNRADYHRYGGRGVTVCADWDQSFETFYADMGDPPPNGTLERVDNDKGYSRENCVWADRGTQARNTVRNVLVDVGGSYELAIHVAERNGISRGKFRQRYNTLGWSVQEACGLVPRTRCAVGK